jgi:VWFA-related protein
MCIRLFICLALLISIALPGTSQQIQPLPAQKTEKPNTAQQSQTDIEDQDVVRITTNLVQVDVVVTKGGKLVTDLRPEDFEILEDGKPQAITNFSYVSNVGPSASVKIVSTALKDKTVSPVAPAKINIGDPRRTVALLVDDLGMSLESIAQVRRQLRKYVEEQLQPNDLVAIIRTGGEIGSLQQFTNDKRLLRDAIDHVKWNPCSRTGLDVFAPERPRGHFEGAAALCGDYSFNSLSAFRFVLRGMKYLPGRKSMVIFSDDIPLTRFEAEFPDDQSTAGDLNNQFSYVAALQKVAEQAIRSSVVIYAADTRGLQYTGPTAADQITYPSRSQVSPDQVIDRIRIARSAALVKGRAGADMLTQETGGFLVRESNDFGLQQVMDDQRGYYLIGYRPTDQTFTRRFHQIKARVKARGLTVRTRAGFFGVTDAEARLPELTTNDEMKKALISPFGANDITVRLTSFFVDEASKGPTLRSFLFLQPRDLTFTEQPDGWRVANLDLRAMLFGDNGRIIGEEDQSGVLRLRGDEYERALREGFVYSFDVPAKQCGGVQFRVAIRDLASSRIGAAGQFIEVPDIQSGRLALSGIVVRATGTNVVKPLELRQDSSDDRRESVVEGPAVRRFRAGSAMNVSYEIYNALIPTSTSRPQLIEQSRIIRDGKSVFTSTATNIVSQTPSDLHRFRTSSEIKLAPDLEPGDYILQVIVTDSSDKQKPRVVSQWIDFEVVK